MPGVDANIQAALEAGIGRGDPSLAGQFVVLLEVDRRNIITDQVDTFYAATKAYTAEDVTPHRFYHPRLRVPDIEQSIWGGPNGWESTSSASSEPIKRIVLDNPDGELDGEFCTDVYAWKGRSARVLGGLLGWDRSQFRTLPGGRLLLLDMLPGEPTVELDVAPLIERMDRPIQANYYGGFGSALDCDSAAFVTIGDVYNLGMRDYTLSSRFNLTSVGLAARTLFQKRAGTAAAAGNKGYAAFFSATGVLTIYLDDGSNFVSMTVGTAGEWLTGEYLELDLVLYRNAGIARAYINGVEEATADISSLTAAITNAELLRHGATTGGTQPFSGIIDEPRVWHKALTPEQVDAVWRFAADGAEDGLVGAWTYDRDEGGDVGIRNVVRGPMIRQASFNGALGCNMGNTADPGASHFALAVWFRVNPGQGGVLASRRTNVSTAAVGYDISVQNGDVLFRASDGSTVYTCTIAGNYADGTAWGACLVYAPGSDELRGYILDYPRGNLTVGTPADTTGSGSFGGGTTEFHLGEFANNSGRLTGRLSWVLYVPVALTEEGVMIALSEQIVPVIAELPTQPPEAVAWANTAGAHWWPLLETSGTVAEDKIGSADGTYSSAPTIVTRDGTLSPGGSSAFVSTLTGDPELKGTPIPATFGDAPRVRLILIDAVRGIYQGSDPSLGAIKSFHRVQAGGEDLAPTTDYTVDLSTATLTAVTPQTDVITADMEGIIDPATGTYLRYPGEITAFAWDHMLGMSGDEISGDSIDEFDKLHPYECGIHISPDERVLLRQFHEMMLSPDGYATRAIDGKMELKTRVDPRPAITLYPAAHSDLVTDVPDMVLGSEHIHSVRRISVPPPSWMVRLGYGRTWWLTKPLSTGTTELAAQQEMIEEWRFVEDSRFSIFVDYPDSLPRVYATPYKQLWDASLLVERMLALDGIARQGWEIVLASAHWSVGMGDVIEVGDYSRYDLSGRRFAVLGLGLGMVNGMARTILRVWG